MNKSSAKKRILSGIKPSGVPHLGNYLGALQRWAQSDPKADTIFFIADLHALTVPQDPPTLRQQTLETVASLLASGIDPGHNTIFLQSQLSAHSELGWLLNCLTPIGWLERMTQFKDKVEAQTERISVGLFDYPVLMAADILLYNTDEVPVGEDQRQHVELTRQLAKRFNSKFGPTFKLPRAVIPPQGARIMSLSDPTKKMSKSDADQRGSILINDSDDQIEQKIKRATTDSGSTVDLKSHSPGVDNLLTIYEVTSGKNRTGLTGKSYAELKKIVSQVVVEALTPIRQRFNQLLTDPTEIEQVLNKSIDHLRPIAEAKLAEVQKKLGLR